MNYLFDFCAYTDYDDGILISSPSLPMEKRYTVGVTENGEQWKEVAPDSKEYRYGIKEEDFMPKFDLSFSY